jgi:hypothetical protein
MFRLTERSQFPISCVIGNQLFRWFRRECVRIGVDKSSYHQLSHTEIAILKITRKLMCPPKDTVRVVPPRSASLNRWKRRELLKLWRLTSGTALLPPGSPSAY